MNKNGFTLVELMLVVVIIGILTAISVPLYTQYIVRSERAAVQGTMLKIAQRLEAYRVQNYSYGGAALSNTGIYDQSNSKVSVTGATVSPIRYNLTLTLPAANTNGNVASWILTATPTGASANDGVVKLNNQGWRCWTKTTTACTLSVTSGWDKGSST